MSDLAHGLELIGLVLAAISGLLYLLTQAEKRLTSPVHIPPAPATGRQSPPEPGVRTPSSDQ